jgi:hypothetical protein
MNITFIHDCVLKVIMKNLECEMNVYVNVTYMTIVLKVNTKNIELISVTKRQMMGRWFKHVLLLSEDLLSNYLSEC